MICQLTIVYVSATYCKTCGQKIHYRNTRYIGRWHDFVYRASLSEPHTKAAKRGYWQILSLQTRKFYKNQKVYNLQSHIHSCFVSVLSFCIQLICSSHSHGYIICTCYTLSSSFGHWPIDPNPSIYIMQPNGHFPLSSIYISHHAHKQDSPPDAKHLSSNTYTVITHCKTLDSKVHYRNTRYIECIYNIIEF